MERAKEKKREKGKEPEKEKMRGKGKEKEKRKEVEKKKSKEKVKEKEKEEKRSKEEEKRKEQETEKEQFKGKEKKEKDNNSILTKPPLEPRVRDRCLGPCPRGHCRRSGPSARSVTSEAPTRAGGNRVLLSGFLICGWRECAKLRTTHHQPLLPGPLPTLTPNPDPASQPSQV